MTAADLLAKHTNKLKSILARRGNDWGFSVPSNNPTPEQLGAFAQHIAAHVANASKVRHTPYGMRGDRLFHITGDEALPDRSSDQMIGSQPTVGCTVFCGKNDPSLVVQQALSALRAASLVRSQGRAENKWLVKATLGSSEADGIMFPLASDVGVAVFLEFDEEECIRIAAHGGQTLEEILLPCADALRHTPNVIAVAIGSELAVPNGFDGESLEDAGVAVLFEKVPSEECWHRKDVYHLIGHTEQPLVGAA